MPTVRKSTKPLLPVPKEQEIVQLILQWCAVHRIWAHRRNTGAMTATYKGRDRFIRFSTRGMSDIWFIYNGIHGECEVKREGQKPTQWQEFWLKQCREAGAIAFVATSLDEFIEKLEAAMLGPL